MSQPSQSSPARDPSSQLIEAHFKEYEVLKGAQIQRIHFRDNQVYTNLAAVGAVALYALGKDANPLSWLVIPWVNVILGGLYLLNDQKVSAMGLYFRRDLGLRIIKLLRLNDDARKDLYWGLGEEKCQHPVLFGWEVAHRSDPDRLTRKIIQFVLDFVTFVLPGAMSLVAYQLFIGMQPGINRPPNWFACAAQILEWVLLIVLTFAILKVSDFNEGADNQE